MQTHDYLSVSLLHYLPHNQLVSFSDALNHIVYMTAHRCVGSWRMFDLLLGNLAIDM